MSKLNQWVIAKRLDSAKRIFIYDLDLDVVCRIEKKIDPKTEVDLTEKNAALIAAAPEMHLLLLETLYRLNAMQALDQHLSEKVLELKNNIFQLTQKLK